MEYIHCNLCGSDNTELLFTKEDKLGISPVEFNVVRCTKCGLIYVNPRPEAKEIAKFYPEGYLWKEADKYKKENFNIINLIEKTYKSLFLNFECETVKSIAGINNERKSRLLDIGCGTGERLNIFRKKSFDTYGLEISNEAEYAKNFFGLEVLKAPLEEANFENNFFDIVTIYNVLEHTCNPSQFILQVNRILNNGGLLVLQIPNTDSLQYMIYQKKWIAFDVPRDLFYFNLRQLQRLLEKAGFSLFKISYISALLHPSIAMSSFSNDLDPQLVWTNEIKTNKREFAKRAKWLLFTLLAFPLLLLECFLSKPGMVTLFLKKKEIA